ncbi:MAG: HAD-IC family P-type ATPase, partial [Candidatus Micrarchaeota archaeon]|nr:HAD-IC family P-type ATPase [Candidatus Micrarchaeota archaeon]
MEEDRIWHRMSPEEAARTLKSSEKDGLAEHEADARIAQYGPNALEAKGTDYFGLLVRQFKSILLWVLLLAAALSEFVGEYANGRVILAIVAIIVAIGFFQEYKADRAVDALRKMLARQVTVVRGGKRKSIDVKELVPGDLITLESGDKVPADAKIVWINGLRVDESTLTGESHAVEKKNGEVLFAGTHVVYGRCSALVFATGMTTRLGHIAQMVQVRDEPVPLQTMTNELTAIVGIAVGLISLLTLAVGLVAGYKLVDMVILAIAVGVAGIPEALPLTVTIALAVGMKKMAENKAIPKSMMAVETLGSVTTICSDKTGTITRNQMTASKVYCEGKFFEIGGEGYDVKGGFSHKGKAIEIKPGSGLWLMLEGGALCNNAEIEEKEGQWEVKGTPTEGALLVAAAKAGIWKDEAEKRCRRVFEIPFSSENKYMATVHECGGKKLMYVKGAPERVLSMCDWVYDNGELKEFKCAESEEINRADKEMALGSMRIIAVAYKETGEEAQPKLEGLVFLGLAGMYDPPREEVVEAVRTCKKAGIRVIMITGDHKHTALAVAKEIGLPESEIVLTGEDLDAMSDEELDTVVNDVFVYARTRPEQKLRIVNSLKRMGHVVAMTGDGVNDAPALRSAHVGVAMGISGTDVSIEAADIVLSDDNMATILEGIKGGRGTFENIRKFTTFHISCNAAEVSITLFALILLPLFGFGVVLPLLPLQILLLNIMIDEFPAVALGIDPIGKDVMNRKPLGKNEPLLHKNHWATV